MHGRLSATKVKTITKPGRHHDHGGLYLQVAPTRDGKGVTKSWCFRFGMNGRERWAGLGAYPTFSLQEARERARKMRQLVADGIDPIEARLSERDARRADEAAAITFKAAAKEYLDVHESGWRNDKHRQQWRTTLETYAFPRLGERPVAAIDTAAINDVLGEIWTTIPETARRVRQRIERVVAWIKDGKPLPAPGKSKRVKHHAAMHYRDVPAFMGELRARESVSAKALEYLILCAGRTGEVIGAKWAEIDVAERIWTVPGERMKAGHEHRVPLSDRALEILQAVPREDGNEFIFIGGSAAAGLSNMALLEMLRGMTDNGYTVHGFRSSFRDWTAELTHFPADIAEAALAHQISDKTRAAYERGDKLDKRRLLMAAWAKFCASTPAAAGEVIPLRSAG